MSARINEARVFRELNLRRMARENADAAERTKNARRDRKPLGRGVLVWSHVSLPSQWPLCDDCRDAAFLESIVAASIRAARRPFELGGGVGARFGDAARCVMACVGPSLVCEGP